MHCNETGRWRCAECGDGEHLTAWAGANIYGALEADGTVREDWTDQWGLHEDSIECTVHPDAAIHKLLDGAWTRSVRCDWRGEYGWQKCDLGRVSNGHGGTYACPGCHGSGSKDVPAEASAAALPGGQS